MFYLMVLGLVLIFTGANCYFYVRLFQTLPVDTPLLRWSVGLLLAALGACFALSMLLRHAEVPEWMAQGLFRVGAVWCMFVLYMVPALLLADGVRLLWPHFRSGFWWAVVLNVGVLTYGYWHYCHPVVNRVKMPQTLRREQGPRRIVALSDVHLGEGTGRNQLARYVNQVNALQPDVVLVVGDLVDQSVRPLLRNDMAAELRRLKAPMGLYMVPGNHEYISGIRAVRNFLKDTPLVLLRDSVVLLPGGIRLVGRDDRFNRHRKSISQLMEGGTGPAIVMDHQPYEVKQAVAAGADLVLCGHTHRGQVWPVNWLTDWLFDQSHGYRRWDRCWVYVMQGLSLWGPPFRIGSDSELVVLE